MMKGTGGKTKCCDNFCNLGQLADLADLLDEYIFATNPSHQRKDKLKKRQLGKEIVRFCRVGNENVRVGFFAKHFLGFREKGTKKTILRINTRFTFRPFYKCFAKTCSFHPYAVFTAD